MSNMSKTEMADLVFTDIVKQNLANLLNCKVNAVSGLFVPIPTLPVEVMVILDVPQVMFPPALPLTTL